jgi:hypothetical protein
MNTINLSEIEYEIEEQEEIELEIADYTFLRYRIKDDTYYYYSIKGEEEIEFDLPLSCFNSTKISEIFEVDGKVVTILVEDLKLIQGLKELNEKANSNKS